MKKAFLISSLLACGMLTAAHAQPQICPFQDQFIIMAPTGNLIKRLNSDGNVYANITDATHFSIFCKDRTNRNPGHAYVTVGTDPANYCNLSILDGPFEMNPSVVSINCGGSLHYAGIDHEYGTYLYTLNFY